LPGNGKTRIEIVGWVDFLLVYSCFKYRKCKI
jgi:hypothetical protein